MGTEQQEQPTKPLPSTAVSKLQRKASLKDVTNIINDVAQSSDEEYTELCHILKDVTGSVEEIKQHRTTNITTLRDDINSLLNTVNVARKSATDTTRLDRFREQVKHLEAEKQQLVHSILTGKDEEQVLKDKLYRVEQQIELVRQEHESVMNQTTSELPSLEYLKKVLHHLSRTYLTKGHPRITEGFVYKKGTKDVRPFHFDDSISHFDQVNYLWKMISDE